MTKSVMVGSFLGLVFTVGASVSPAHALVTRTWVSGVGNDGNPCSRSAPCKTFAGAFAQTAAGGEINVLDPGGYGTLTINKAISIYNDGVGEAGVVSQNTNGITIAAGASDVVNLRGLILNGSSSSGSGVQITSAGRVNIQNCVIQQFGSGTGQGGINISPSSGAMEVKVQDTTIINNNIGMFVKPTGGATVDLSIDHTRIDNNLGGGMRADGTGGGTVFAGITDSSMSLNAANGVVAIAGPGSATVSLMRDVFHGNGQYGLQSSQSSGTAVITVGQSVLSNNTSGAVNVAGGTLQTYQTNQITGSLGTGFSGTISQQ